MAGDPGFAAEFWPFEFATAAKIRFGSGVLSEIGAEAARWGRAALVVTGSASQDTDRLTGLLEQSKVSARIFRVHGEPRVADVEDALELARAEGCDLVIGFGGGSAIDAAKAAAVLLANPGDVLDYLEVVGRGRALQNPGIPFLAVPTTAGTGSEVTRNAVLAVPEQQVKVSLRSPGMLARAAFIDPELTYSLPPAVTAATGMDALAQLIEPYVSRRANPLTDLFCRAGIARALACLPRAYHDGGDREARAGMALASCLGGLALANAGLGVVHGLAGPIGGMFPAPHGAVCAALLPPAVRVNYRVLAEEHPGHPALDRYKDVAALAAGDDRPDGMNGLVERLDALRQELNIPGLQEYGITPADLEQLAEKGAAASSTKANPISLSKEQLREILALAL